MKKALWPRIVGFGVGGVALLGILVVGVFIYQAISVASNLLAAKDEISAVADEASNGDPEAVLASAEDIREMVSDANDKVSSPLWSAASNVPIVGENVNAVRLATQATHTVIDGALEPGVKILNSLDLSSTDVEGGGIDLAPLRDAQEDLPEISAAIEKANETIGGIDRSKVLPVVDDALGSLTDAIEVAGPGLEIAQEYLPQLLDIAGADEPRRYMLVFQNNAEIRSGGGLPAATAIVDVEDGKAKMADQTSTYSFDRFTKVFHPEPEMDQLYVEDTFTGFGNFTRTPDFPTTAQSFDQLWFNKTGERLDGVITIDPVVLSYMLEATGPVISSDGVELTSDNAVETLLYDAYHMYTGKQQDEFFGDVAAKVFEKISDGDWDPLEMVDQLVRAADEERLHAWFPDEDEQGMVEELELEGSLATDNEEVTEVGLFVNDYSASKLEYFLDTAVSLTCNVEAGTMTTSIDVTNSVPEGGMTKYQLGIRNDRYGIPSDSFILDVMYFAPPGSMISLDDELPPVWERTPEQIALADSLGADPVADVEWERRTGVEYGRNVEVNRYFVPRGETKTISYTSTIPEGELGPANLRYSPTVTDTETHVGESCASVFSER